jgi:hypothetical protein
MPTSPEPNTPSGKNPNFTPYNEQLDCILDVVCTSWAESIKKTYEAGLLVFHVYCNSLSIPEDQRCPINHNLLLAFLSSCTESYSGMALANYAAALRA